MSGREHVHSANGLCPECCRLVARPPSRIMSVLSDIFYPLRGLFEDATDEVGNVLTRLLASSHLRTVENEPAMEPSMQPAMEPTMQSATEPRMQPAMESAIQPAMESAIQPATESTMQPAMEPTMQPAMEPTMQPAMESTIQRTLESVIQRTLESAILQRTVEPAIQPVIAASNSHDQVPSESPLPQVIPTTISSTTENSHEGEAIVHFDLEEVTSRMVAPINQASNLLSDAAASSQGASVTESASPKRTDWVDYAKSNYLKARQISDAELPPEPSRKENQSHAPIEEEEVLMRGKVDAKRASAITAQALMGLQFEARVQEASRPFSTDGSSITANNNLQDKSQRKQRDWMALIAVSREESPAKVLRQDTAVSGKTSADEPSAKPSEEDKEHDELVQAADQSIETPTQVMPVIVPSQAGDIQYLDATPEQPLDRHPDQTLDRGPDNNLDQHRQQHQEHNHEGRTVCELCMAKLARPGNQYWEELKENALVVGRGALFVGQVIGIGVFGAAMAVASFIPTVVRPQTLEDIRREEEERKAKLAQKHRDEDADQARWEEETTKFHDQKEREHKAWTDSEQALWKARKTLAEQGEAAADDEFWTEYKQRGEETAAERQAWEKARTQWESDKAANLARKKNEEDTYWNERQKRQEEDRLADERYWRERQMRYEEDRAAQDRYAREADERYWNERK